MNRLCENCRDFIQYFDTYCKQSQMDQSFLTKHVITRLSKRESIAHNGEEVHFHSITSQICSRHDYLCSVKSVNLRGIDWAISRFDQNPESCPINYEDSQKLNATIIS